MNNATETRKEAAEVTIDWSDATFRAIVTTSRGDITTCAFHEANQIAATWQRQLEEKGFRVTVFKRQCWAAA